MKPTPEDHKLLKSLKVAWDEPKPWPKGAVDRLLSDVFADTSGKWEEVRAECTRLAATAREALNLADERGEEIDRLTLRLCESGYRADLADMHAADAETRQECDHAAMLAAWQSAKFWRRTAILLYGTLAVLVVALGTAVVKGWLR